MSVQTLYNQATNLFKSNEFEKTLCVCNEMLTHDQDYADAHALIGIIGFNKYNTGRAFDKFKQAISLDPTKGEDHHNLGIALNSLGRERDAISCFSKSIDLQHKIAISLNNIGGILKGLGRFQEATTCFKKALELNPKDNLVAHNLFFMDENHNISIDPSSHISPLCTIKSDAAGR